ncbi:MAG: hypothetical protein KF892_19695 [Rhizobacter sp.]|nr:hypothetical protein [Rhizobacter sp.]
MRRPPDFKPTQVFDWAHEPSDERPTDFGRSTGYSALSGFGSLQEVSGSAHRRQRSQGASMARLMAVTCVVLGLSVSALYTMVHYLRGG